MHWKKITIVGVGLLGGSLGLAIKQRRLADSTVGLVRRSNSIPECEMHGVVDHATCDAGSAAADADLVIFCTPIAQMRELAAKIFPTLKPGTLVTDVGSVKGSVMRDLEPLAAECGVHFIGSHPMAGSEKMGPGAARADLFQGAICVLTPNPKSPPDLVARLNEFWMRVGATTMRLTPDAHDELVSRSSHLPHVVAAELANYVLSPVHPKQQADLCATGFRDTTRIASGSPEMWRDIAMANRKNLARVLGVFIEDLQEFQLALEKEDVNSVAEFFTQAKQRRDAWSGDSLSTSPE